MSKSTVSHLREKNYTVYICFLRGWRIKQRMKLFASTKRTKTKWQTLQNWLQRVATMIFHIGWLTSRVTIMWYNVNTRFGAMLLCRVFCHFPVIFLTNSGVTLCSIKDGCGILKTKELVLWLRIMSDIVWHVFSVYMVYYMIYYMVYLDRPEMLTDFNFEKSLAKSH